eukprot:365328-Chlamydomonas_euryale.AAC.2
MAVGKPNRPGGERERENRCGKEQVWMLACANRQVGPNPEDGSGTTRHSRATDTRRPRARPTATGALQRGSASALRLYRGDWSRSR